MKKYLWVLVLALVVSSIPASSFASTSHTQQDQAFLSSLAKAVQAPVTPILAADPPEILAPPASCVNLACSKDSDCWPYCGGPDASYCSYGVYRRCVPY
ncbi:MAG TPA: hypothetical protein VMM92_15590 [Thermoanaerobaculia bacterium]|nr:hypothetical protein [Thermoanaerobaculia bacterium]